MKIQVGDLVRLKNLHRRMNQKRAEEENGKLAIITEIAMDTCGIQMIWLYTRTSEILGIPWRERHYNIERWDLRPGIER